MKALDKKCMTTNIGSSIMGISILFGKLFSSQIAALITISLLMAARLCQNGTAATPMDQVADQTITLAEAIEISLANNPELAAKRYGVDAARAEYDIAVGARLPEFYLLGRYNYYRAPRLIQPRRPGTSESLAFTDELLSGDFVLTMPLYTGGQLRNQVIATDLITQAKWERLLYSRAELVFNVSSVFYAMLGQHEVIASLQFSQKALEQHHKKTQELLNAQKAARVDLLRTEVRLADIQQQLLRERNALEVQGYLLASLLGLGGKEEPLEIEGELMLMDVPANLDQAIGIAFGNRQDYQSLKYEVRAQQTQVNIARGKRLPELALYASYGDRWATDSSKHNEVGEVGMLFDVPLFEGGRINAGIRREYSRLGAQQEALRALELKIQLEVETSISNIESTRARITVTQKAVEQAEESLRIERGKYDQGKGAIVDVLDAQSALLDSQTNYYRALAEYNTALAQFRLAVGENE
ncbi:MAG: TolC family protein [Pirellulales bacterium]|nr:TolC family protein [Pirellulales bacterium]